MQPDTKPATGGKSERSGSSKALNATVVTTLAVVLAVYIGALVGYRLLEQPPKPFEFTESSVIQETAVIIRLGKMETVENKLTVDVLVHPDNDILSAGPEAAANPIVRLSSWTADGELIHMHDDLRSNESTVELTAVGDPDHWPLDTYVSNTIGVEVFFGDEANKRSVPAVLVVAGAINGWEVDSNIKVLEAPWGPIQSVSFHLDRTRGAHAVDFGILLVLMVLPGTALFVAIEMLLNRRKFLPPFITWYAAMLFAVVPLRNILPGAPPTGAWIDVAVILWVLLALSAAMVVFLVAWWRQTREEEQLNPKV
ncbi:DUF4436 domain-containing protein [Mycolicibacterium parafortuitum]|uniref:DUF4436 domain-containing protein n=1 Tax=Mycolicibacterium parafortuitum TaxID=39692 RepID=A0A7I7U8E2_MYCPF|nr:DUF4436 family protein [Mycolicibacterium parafortuitum]BBY77694.1 DUF4436 domain-containing protein [Mycolicibacterium parafortuitum]